jgi:hypothetical protein
MPQSDLKTILDTRNGAKVRIAARRFYRHCEHVSRHALGSSEDQELQQVRDQAVAALKAFAYIKHPAIVGCPHVEKLLHATSNIFRVIINCAKASIEREELPNLVWTSLANAAQHTTSEISKHLPTIHQLDASFKSTLGSYTNTLEGKVNQAISIMNRFHFDSDARIDKCQFDRDGAITQHSRGALPPILPNRATATLDKRMRLPEKASMYLISVA